MRKEYSINEGHPVVEAIRQEILKSPGYTKDIIGIYTPAIYNRALCSTDIYGFRFNANNWDILTINVGTYFNPKSELAPPILSDVDKGYDYYGTSSNVSIKLKTFLERNPQFSDISEWTQPVVHPKEKLRYSGHRSDDRRFSVDGIEGVKYEVSFPESVIDDRDILEWSKPACEALTKSYWREVALDKSFNIIRGRRVGIEVRGSGCVWFYYDYKDGVVEVYDASNHAGSIWSVFELFEPKPETLHKIKEEIETGDLEVKEVKFIKKSPKKTRFKYEELVG